jgi:hypothetical protein
VLLRKGMKANARVKAGTLLDALQRSRINACRNEAADMHTAHVQGKAHHQTSTDRLNARGLGEGAARRPRPPQASPLFLNLRGRHSLRSLSLSLSLSLSHGGLPTCNITAFYTS